MSFIDGRKRINPCEHGDCEEAELWESSAKGAPKQDIIAD